MTPARRNVRRRTSRPRLADNLLARASRTGELTGGFESAPSARDGGVFFLTSNTIIKMKNQNKARAARTSLQSVAANQEKP